MHYENTESNEKLLIENIPLVKSIVKKIDLNNSGYDLDDLFNIGMIGLMDAIDKFDDSKEVPFEVYARIRIRGAVIDELRKTGPVSRNRMEKLNEYNKVKKKLRNTNNREPTEQEICEEMRLSAKALSKIYETLHYLSSTSLDALVLSIEGENTKFLDILEDRKAINPQDALEGVEISEKLISAIEELEDREKILLRFYYIDEVTMREISYIMNLSVPRVSQMHKKIILKLRHSMEGYI